MRAVHRLGAAAVASLALTSAAHATLSVSMVRTPISSAARAADPALGTFGVLGYNGSAPFARTFDIKVQQGASEHWSFGSALVTLNTGSMAGNVANNVATFYTPASNNLHVQPNPIAAANLQFDTYVTSPDGGGVVSLLGKADYPVTSPGTPSMPGVDTSYPGYNNTAGAIDLTWGDSQAITRTTGDGTYTVARLTVLGKSGGTIVGHVGGTQHNFTDVPFTVTIPMQGDFNDNGLGNNQDINQFLQALVDPAGYAAAFPNVNLVWTGDFNDDGAFNNQDINGYTSFLVSAGPVPADQLAALGALVPEPTSLGLLAIGAVGILARRRK